MGRYFFFIFILPVGIIVDETGLEMLFAYDAGEPLPSIQ